MSANMEDSIGGTMCFHVGRTSSSSDSNKLHCRHIPNRTRRKVAMFGLIGGSLSWNWTIFTWTLLSCLVIVGNAQDITWW